MADEEHEGVDRLADLADRRASLVDEIRKIDAEMSKIEQETAEPKSVREMAQSWIAVIAFIDESEIVLRDMIERDLSHIANLSHVKIADYNATVDVLMRRVNVLRTKAFKAAFAYARKALGDKPILDTSLALWAKAILLEDLKGIDSEIRTGLIAGLDSTEVARKVVGSQGLNGIDGVTEFTRRKIAHLGRVSIRDRHKPSKQSGDTHEQVPTD